jgi:hypothetical protein
VNAPELGKLFKRSKQVSIAESCPRESLSINGDNAEWNCSETTTADGETKQPVPVKWKLVKRGDPWVFAHRSIR